MPILSFKNVSYVNSSLPILNNISISIDPGEFILITGPSGSGKSTLLKLCSHLISPTEGDIFFRNRNVIDYNPAELRKCIAHCFQTPYLFGDTVQENLDFPFIVRNVKPDRARVDELFDMFGMEAGYLKKEVKNLSGGEKQRLSLIRSLIFRPEILLLDEVTSALDADNAELVGSIITALNQEGITILLVTHSPEQIRHHANKLLTMEAGEFKS